MRKKLVKQTFVWLIFQLKALTAFSAPSSLETTSALDDCQASWASDLNKAELLVESVFLQVRVDTQAHQVPQTADPKPTDLLVNAVRHFFNIKAVTDGSGAREKIQVSALLRALEKISVYLIGMSYVAAVAAAAWLLLMGLPKRPPQHHNVQKGGSTSLVIFLGSMYAFCYFATDQYLPSLPQMEVLLVGSIFLTVASFCCGCAGKIEWFLAARVLQGMGESVEPVVFAMARDFFPRQEERFVIVAAMKLMSFVGISMAPFVGGLFAALCSWRASFFGLAGIFATLCIYAFCAVEESCPDIKPRSYLNDVSRIFDPHLLALLMAESFIFGGYWSFNANVSYLMEVNFGLSTMSSACAIMVFAVLAGFGTFCVERLRLSRVLDTAKVALTMMGLSGLTHLVLGILLFNYLWVYVIGTSMQAASNMISAVSLNVLFFEPLADCAGMAASCEILAQSILPSAISVFATQQIIRQGPMGLILVQASSCLCAGLVFWLGYASSPPDWTLEPVHLQALPKSQDSSPLGRLSRVGSRDSISEDFMRENSPTNLYLRREAGMQ